MAKKYYVVWKGKRTGVFESWDQVKTLIQGVSGAKYKSFPSRQQAESAFKNPESVVSTPKKKKARYYVIWDGENSGIYTDWAVAQKKLKGISRDHFKTFGSQVLAEKALLEGPENYKGKDFRKTQDLSRAEIEKIGDPVEMSLAVDAACNEMTGIMEYQGMWTFDPENPVFRKGPYNGGTNNIGEFLALVHALALFQNEKDPKFKKMPIYSDSRIAMGWVKAGKCRTKAKPGREVKELILRAEKWLATNKFKNPIWKWETKVWGEIPADFGRK
ncbi:MAG: ribonuclease H family protein [Crocinitomicaceae bacterium]|nr:ribonuclease H family protein [Crocinitomicaceae bacterium]